MKKLNSNNRFFEQEKAGPGSHSQPRPSGDNHASGNGQKPPNVAPIGQSQKLHILNQHLVK